jgi:hypothetical protein
MVSTGKGVLTRKSRPTGSLLISSCAAAMQNDRSPPQKNGRRSFPVKSGCKVHKNVSNRDGICCRQNVRAIVCNQMMSLGEATPYKFASPLDDLGGKIRLHSRIPLNCGCYQRIQRKERNRDKDSRAQTWQNLLQWLFRYSLQNQTFSEAHRQNSQKIYQISGNTMKFGIFFFWSGSSEGPSESKWEELMFVAFNCCKADTKVWNQTLYSLKEWSSCLEVSELRKQIESGCIFGRISSIVKGQERVYISLDSINRARHKPKCVARSSSGRW